MRKQFTCLITIAIITVLGVESARGEDFFFKGGDVVVMIGDSITEQHLYSNYVEMWTVSRFPTWKLTFRNVGISGDRSIGGNEREALEAAEREVGARGEIGHARALVEADGQVEPLRLLVEREEVGIGRPAAKIRVAWITPSPMEKQENGPAIQGYNETLEKFSAGVREIAEKNHGLFIDQFHPFIDIQDKARAADARNRIGGGDPVHPKGPGQALMAWAILKGMHFPTLVSAVEIDAGSSEPSVKTHNCKVAHLQRKNGGLAFEQEDGALPFFPDEAASILRWAPILDELNQYTLKVAGLKPGRYEIRLGGKKVAEHSDADLAAGVNLAAAALKTGPLADQVKRVWEAVKAKNDYYHNRIFRGVVLYPVKLPDFLDIHLTPEEIEAKRQAAVAGRLTKMPQYDAAIQKALIMHPHPVEIVALEK